MSQNCLSRTEGAGVVVARAKTLTSARAPAARQEVVFVGSSRTTGKAQPLAGVLRRMPAIRGCRNRSLDEARPGAIVLLVAVEICTLAFRLDELTKANIVATALFGDGAAACVLRAGEAGLAAVEMSGQHTWPDTLDIMGWNVDPQGFGVIFDRAIPPFAEEHIAPALAGLLSRAELSLADIDRFACHPGGSKVIAALERALSLEQGVLDHERNVLAEYGNMSAPTALFVLERLIGAGLPPRTLLTAMGPGFTSSCVSLKRAA